ncbi:hypothetical protein [Phytoactinopolyspora mesophila]|uniref:Uncharacterized protein n=1 Tax=Phytoactinopolyspora mesophila TaxID=2650750 RepID=A0A7K3M3E8_9ACTN|nr:hypothetical protein [Phytoactinopolyspora mesophila]NDL57851.1 hypothetical protein [Phytoactinopolyspora mesophila]
MADTTAAPPPVRPSGRIRWAMYAAAGWSLAYGLLALGWTVTGRGFPLGENDPEGALSLLENLPANVGAPLFAAAALAGAGIAFLMARWPHSVQERLPGGSHGRPEHVVQANRQLRSWWRATLIVVGSLMALGWLLVVPDARVLAIVGYLPLVIVVAPFDAEMRADFIDAMDWVYLNHLAVLVGGFAWVLATAVFARRTAGRCEKCGRGGRLSSWMDPSVVARRGRIAVAIAMVIPAFYALTRWVWVAGVPLGIDSEHFDEATATGDLTSGAWLGSFALVGSLLTLGLVQKWGEIFPRWMPVLRGRRVPLKLAVIPASGVSALTVSAGLSLAKIGLDADRAALSLDNWAAVGPALFWPLWGVALAVATYCYYIRRRGACTECGRSDGPGADPRAEHGVLKTGGRRAPEPAEPGWR